MTGPVVGPLLWLLLGASLVLAGAAVTVPWRWYDRRGRAARAIEVAQLREELGEAHAAAQRLHAERDRACAAVEQLTLERDQARQAVRDVLDRDFGPAVGRATLPPPPGPSRPAQHARSEPAGDATDVFPRVAPPPQLDREPGQRAVDDWIAARTSVDWRVSPPLWPGLGEG